ncbi:ElyC/SanA/YdcF family protein [Pigmentibacter sp. JX0631]|uniref:SanA/YdcF family protein n=1 Tax=Pigmentibacter sp. JX0631 TaxID=2976982 RepID=UPI00246827AB|nr:ElyC/SanA/YdcF family protein [Pigmentibacter sp. JX0631]WGL60221.1 ElyC/SanA/YdcF family protein [Pigmentibacter sp. JX0631]
MIPKFISLPLKILKFIFISVFLIFSIVCLIFLATNTIMYINSQSSETQTTAKEFAIVLGASVHGDSLSGLLKARMEKAIELYDKKLVKTILMSGDGTDSYYNETAAMKKYALKHGIPEEVLITDEKGYNTYATILRAKEVFNAQSAYIISQNFHLARAVWLAREIGIDAQGVNAGESKNNWYYSFREFLARTKDYFQVVFKVTPYDDKFFDWIY